MKSWEKFEFVVFAINPLHLKKEFGINQRKE
jgi:hypothetical protein